MAKKKAAKLVPGDRVIVAGREYRVDKVKPKGKTVKLTLALGTQAFTSKVPAGDVFQLAASAAPSKRGKLHDERGAQTRWATNKEARRKGLKPGDASVTTPSVPPMGDPWETPRDRVERKLDTLLGARLVGEATDEASGYYVPPVDISTVAAHLALFHGVDPSEYGIDDMLDLHQRQHVEHVGAGIPLAVNHWHSDTRPANVNT